MIPVAVIWTPGSYFQLAGPLFAFGQSSWKCFLPLSEGHRAYSEAEQMATFSRALLFFLPNSSPLLADSSSYSILSLSSPTPQKSPFKKNLSRLSRSTVFTQIRCRNLREPSERSTVEVEGLDVEEDAVKNDAFLFEDAGSWAIVSSCLVGLVTGLGVVVFNNGVHELRDFFWDGIPARGASWLREVPTEATWSRVVLVPAFGGLIVGILNLIRSSIDVGGGQENHVKAVFRPVLKAVAASVTLGTGKSLGPEGPSVEIGASVAEGIGNLFDKSSPRKPSLVAAGSAAGISSG